MEDRGAYDNVCFSHRLAAQRYRMGDTTLNVCHFHPLGAQWRDVFCEGALGFLGLDVPDVNMFCSDACYYQGRDGGRDCGGEGGLAGTPDYGEYYRSPPVVGAPVGAPEVVR